MTTTLRSSLYVLGAFAFLLLAYFLTSGGFARASAPSGLAATVATSTTINVSGTAISVFATSTCAARIITTEEQPISITFSDYANQTPSATVGHVQAASTTVAYDSGQYGCGLLKVFGYGADTIRVTETR